MADPRFIGTLILHNPSDVKKMTVGKDFSFEDSRGILWTVHKGDVTDGASIPNQLKLFIGGSYQTPYLKAAILHDVYCQNKTHSWQDTDRMFYEAMRTNGVGRTKATLMWLAVYTFGPHW